MNFGHREDDSQSNSLNISRAPFSKATSIDKTFARAVDSLSIRGCRYNADFSAMSYFL